VTYPCGTGEWCETCCNECINGECNQSYCADAIAACDAEPDCADLEACVAQIVDGMGFDVCMGLYSDGYEPLMALYTCEKCDACLGDCKAFPNDYACPISWNL
jgi:hypothetical protein